MKMIVKWLSIALVSLILGIFLTPVLTETVSLFTTERYQQGDAPHKWFSVAIYATDDKGERYVGKTMLSHFSSQHELWQGSEPHYDDFVVEPLGEQTYELAYEIGLGVAYATYRIENGRVVPLSFDHQWYESLCFFAAWFLAAYGVNWAIRTSK